MKKTLVILCAFLSLGIAADRMVLGELFTSTTCGPCVGGNSALNTILNQKEDYLAVVRFHMGGPSPGNDPFYRYNPAPNGSRANRYGIQYIPSFVVDGIHVMSNSEQSQWGTKVDERHGEDSPVFMKVYRTYEPAVAMPAEQGEGQIVVALTNEQTDESISADVWGALTESNVSYTGVNGDPTHHQVMLDIVTDFGWTLELGPEETRVMTFFYDTYDTVPFLTTSLEPNGETHVNNAENCELVFWYQDKVTDEIIQAAKSDVVDTKELTVTDIEFVDSSGDGELSPGEHAEVHLTVSNGENSRLDDVRAYLEIRESEVSIVSNDAYVDRIGPGDSHRFEGGELAVEASADYDGASFTLYCYAGSGDGSLATAMQPLGVTEESGPRFVGSLPSIALPGSTIDLSPANMDGEVKIDLIDASGRKVAGLYSGSAAKLENIKLPDAAAGLYFVRAATASGTQTSKIVLLP